jgi:hypothetical protein
MKNSSFIFFIFIGILVFLEAGRADQKDLNTTIIERLASINHNKIESLLKHIGKEAPPNLYNCLCVKDGGGASMGVSVFYHPDIYGTYDERYICNRPGDPCIASGFGCWRFPLPRDPKIWEECLHKAKYEDNSTIVDAIAKEILEIRKLEHEKQKSREKAQRSYKYTDIEIRSEIDNYGKILKRVMFELRMQGYPMDRIEKFNAMMRRHILKLEVPGELPGFWESLGLTSPPRKDASSLESWQKAMLKKYDAQFIKLLKSGKPIEIAKGLRQYSQAIAHYDEAMQIQADGALDQITANQTLVKDVLESTPYVGEALDSYALIGYLGEQVGLTDSRDWTLNGDQVTALDAFFRFAGTGGPASVKLLMKKSKTAQKVVTKIGGMVTKHGKSSKKMIKNMLGSYSDTAQKGFDNVVEVLTKERHLIKKEYNTKISKRVDKFINSPKGAEDIAKQ